MKWAFSDESRRRGSMYLGVVIIATHEVAEARVRMRGLLLPRQRRLHLTDERLGRRRQIASEVLDLPVTGFVLRGSTEGRRVPEVRRALLHRAVELMVNDRVERWTLDGVERVQRDRDRSDIAAALAQSDANPGFVYDHEPSAAEPLLWAADAVTWMMGAGGELAGRCREQFKLVAIDT